MFEDGDVKQKTGQGQIWVSIVNFYFKGTFKQTPE